MNRTLSAIALAASLALAMPANARWYTSHFGAEDCVPLDDITEDQTRVYYGTGPWQEPEDFVRYLRNGLGATVTPIPGTNPGVKAYRASDGKDRTIFMFFESEILCRITTSTMER